MDWEVIYDGAGWPETIRTVEGHEYICSFKFRVRREESRGKYVKLAQRIAELPKLEAERDGE
jgi:hypothetical protein